MPFWIHTCLLLPLCCPVRTLFGQPLWNLWGSGSWWKLLLFKNKNLVKTMFNSNSVKQQPRPKELRIAISNDAFIGDTFMCNSIWICQITIYVPCYLFSLLSGLLRLTFSERGLCVRQITEEYSRWRSAAIAKSHFYILKNKTFLETKWIAQFMSQDFSCTKSHFTFIGY